MRLPIRMQTREPNVIGVQEQEMYPELLDRMIDDRLEEHPADRAHIDVTPGEIDRGISRIAAQAQQQQGRPVTTADVVAEVRRRGMSEQDFRGELRRQILEGKLIELRVRPRVRVTEHDAHVAYAQWVKELATMPTLPARIPGYDEVNDERTQQAAVEGLERARRQWLGKLRRGVYVDVRS
jgi:peptidyl-prolyl cis-trans isomerase SurA